MHAYVFEVFKCWNHASAEVSYLEKVFCHAVCDLTSKHPINATLYQCHLLKEQSYSFIVLELAKHYKNQSGIFFELYSDNSTLSIIMHSDSDLSVTAQSMKLSYL